MSRSSAARVDAGLHGEQQHQYLTFHSGDELFAMPIARVREIIEFGSLTPVPMMPTFIRGVINIRGAVVPVVDLSARFGRAVTEAGRRSCVIILEMPAASDETSLLGVLVDAVSAVLDAGPEAIEPRPDFGAHIPSDFIEGMLARENGFIIILAVERVLALDLRPEGGSTQPALVAQDD
jgi:purine-binding chemotaxis protein CheW